MKFYIFLWLYIIPVIVCLSSAVVYEKLKAKIKWLGKIEEETYPFNPLVIFIFMAFVPPLNLVFCYKLVEAFVWFIIGFVFGFFKDKNSDEL